MSHDDSNKISPTLELNEKCKALEAQGVDVIKWGFGQSPFPLHQLMKEALKNNSHQNKYLPVEGLPELRKLIVKYYKKFNVNSVPENVVVAPGTKELLFILAKLWHGDFIIPTPGWVSYFNQLKLLGRSWIPLETSFETGWKVQPEDLEEVLLNPNTNTPKILILNSPNNPTGQIYSRAELEEIVKVCRRRDTWVLSDEIYNEIDFDGKFCSIASLYPEKTIIANGISKSYDAGGWRFGYFIFPSPMAPLRLKVKQLASEIYSCVAAPIQYAMIDILTQDLSTGELGEYIKYKNKILKNHGTNIAERLSEMGVKTHIPEGSFYMFLDFSNFWMPGVTSREFFNKLLDEVQIALLTGECFGRDGDSEWTARLAFVDLDKMEPRVVHALDRLEEWLNNKL